jgi:hypothetical protein
MWRDLFTTHPKRFMTPLDTYVTDRHRVWLAQLPPDIARGIAHGNAARLFGAGGVAELERQEHAGPPVKPGAEPSGRKQ